MLCQKCNKNPGVVYLIHYGKRLGQRTDYVVNGTKTTTSYHIGGMDQVYLCKECTRRSPWDIVKFIAATILVLGLGFLCIYSITSSWNDILCLPFGIVTLGGLMLWSFLMQNVTENQGEKVAKKMLHAKYKPEEYDTFWNSKEFNKLEKR